jgi:hypothetical protein
VNTGADLNVYLETGEDGEKKDGEKKDGAGGCCAPSQVESGCCAPAVPAGVVPDKTDLNDFVGELGV